jgi:hypothetical protein
MIITALALALTLPLSMLCILLVVADAWPEQYDRYTAIVARIPGLQRSWDAYYRTCVRVVTWLRQRAM